MNAGFCLRHKIPIFSIPEAPYPLQDGAPPLAVAVRARGTGNPTDIWCSTSKVAACWRSQVSEEGDAKREAGDRVLGGLRMFLEGCEAVRTMGGSALTILFALACDSVVIHLEVKHESDPRCAFILTRTPFAESNMRWDGLRMFEVRFYPHTHPIRRIQHEVGWRADVRGVWPGGSCLRLGLVNREGHHTTKCDHWCSVSVERKAGEFRFRRRTEVCKEKADTIWNINLGHYARIHDRLRSTCPIPSKSSLSLVSQPSFSLSQCVTELQAKSFSQLWYRPLAVISSNIPPISHPTHPPYLPDPQLEGEHLRSSPILCPSWQQCKTFPVHS